MIIIKSRTQDYEQYDENIILAGLMVFTVLVIILIISSPFYIAGKIYVRSSFLISHLSDNIIFGFVIIFFTYSLRKRSQKLASLISTRWFSMSPRLVNSAKKSDNNL